MATRILFLHHTAIIGGAELHLLSVARRFRESSTVVLFADGPFRQALETAGDDPETMWQAAITLSFAGEAATAAAALDRAGHDLAT